MRGICSKKSIFFDAWVFRTKCFCGVFILSLYLKSHIQEWQGAFSIQRLCTKYVKKKTTLFSVFTLICGSSSYLWLWLAENRRQWETKFFVTCSHWSHTRFTQLCSYWLVQIVRVIAWPWTWIHSFNVRLSSLYTQL